MARIHRGDGYPYPMHRVNCVCADNPVPALRQQLADEIVSLVSHLNSMFAASVLCIDEARLSDLRHGRAQRFSDERLIRILANVQRRVDLIVVNTGPAQPLWPILRRQSSTRRNAAS